MSSPLSRRNFLQTAGALGLGAAIANRSLFAADKPALPAIAKRGFGRLGVEVPVLGLGCMFDTINAQAVLKQAFEHGITYWDTASGYGKGASETGISMFLDKNPGARKQLFIVSKATGVRSPKDLTKALDASLARLKTDYVDLYYFPHGAKDIAQIDQPEYKAWAEQMKKAGKIRGIGFSTHANMEQLLLDASKLAWIDAIMLTYNYRNMESPEMKRGVEAASKAGIALIAMKVMGEGNRRNPQGPAGDADKLLEPLTAKGLTPGQAKIKAVLAMPGFSLACVQMPNLKFFQENFAGVADGRALTVADSEALRRHADATCSNYCAGCTHLCETALAGQVPVRDVLRYVMYHENYGMREEARAMFSDLPEEVRARLLSADYRAAESLCPQRVAIADTLRHAHALLA
jgi:predicted aldo/keto reductase-like oxidoreductase